MTSGSGAGNGRLRPPAALGLALVTVLITEAIAIRAGAFAPIDGYLSGVVTSLPFVWIPIYGSYRAERSDFDPDRYRRIVRWCLGGAVTSLLVNARVIVTRPLGGAFPVLVRWIRWAASIGGGTGFLVGVERIVDAHGWSIRVIEGSDGGARFEITGVSRRKTPPRPGRPRSRAVSDRSRRTVEGRVSIGRSPRFPPSDRTPGSYPRMNFAARVSPMSVSSSSASSPRTRPAPRTPMVTNISSPSRSPFTNPWLQAAFPR